MGTIELPGDLPAAWWEMQARTLEELGYCIVGKDEQAHAAAAELRRQAAAFGGWHQDDVVRAHALRDLFLRRADELDPQGGAR